MANAERYSFKNLEVWKAAQEFAVTVSLLVDDLPGNRTTDVVGRQLLRSATSIGANIAEGHSRFTLGAYRNHLSIAKGSAGESEHWLDLLMRRGFVDADVGQEMSRTCATLMGALTRRILALEQQEKRVREDGPIYSVQGHEIPWFPGSTGSMVPIVGLHEEEDER